MTAEIEALGEIDHAMLVLRILKKRDSQWKSLNRSSKDATYPFA